MFTVLSDTTKQKSKDKVIEVMSTNEIIYLVDKDLKAKTGLNRYHWDMRYTGPWNKSVKKRYQKGTIAAPGIYTVRFTFNKEVFDQEFELLIDPRVEAEGISVADINTQVAMQQKIVNLLSESRKLQASLEKESKALKNKKSNSKAERLKKISAALKLLKDETGAYPKPMLNNQISYLLNVIANADQLLGENIDDRLEVLSNQFDEVKKGLK